MPRSRLALDPVLLGLYAWATTIGVPVFSGDATAVAGLFATSAVLSLVLAWVVAGRWQRPADLLLVGFLLLSLVTWVKLGHAQLAANLGSLRTAMGSIGWGLFAVAWVHARQVRHDKSGTFDQIKSFGLAGNALLLIALALACVVVSGPGIQNGTGRGVFVTALAVAWSLGMLDTAGLLATRLELQSKGLGLRLLTEPRILIALGLATIGLLSNEFAR